MKKLLFSSILLIIANSYIFAGKKDSAILKQPKLFKTAQLCPTLIPMVNSDLWQIYCVIPNVKDGSYNPTLPLCTPQIPFFSTDLWQIYCALNAMGPGTGTVTDIYSGTGITCNPDPIISTGTVSISNTGVTPGAYGSATTIPTYTVNAQGQLTAAANVSFTSALTIPTAEIPFGTITGDSAYTFNSYFKYDLATPKTPFYLCSFPGDSSDTYFEEYGGTLARIKLMVGSAHNGILIYDSNQFTKTVFDFIGNHTRWNGIAFNFPTTIGTNGYVLTTDGYGNTSWQPTSGGLTGGDTIGGANHIGTNTQIATNFSSILVGGQAYGGITDLAFGNTSGSTRIISGGGNYIKFMQGVTDAGQIYNNNAYIGLGLDASNGSNSNCTNLGAYSAYNHTGTGNTSVGAFSNSNGAGNNNTCNGYYATVNSNAISNSSSFGYQANATGSNEIKLGNASSDSLSTAASININQAPTIVNGTIAGTANFSQPFGGTSYKKVVIVTTGLTGTASYTFPFAFDFTPGTFLSSNMTGGSLSVISLSTTAVTITGVTLGAGVIILEGQ